MTVTKWLAMVAGLLACVALPAMAEEDLESELARMRKAMESLEAKVEAQEEELEQQGELLEEHQKLRQRELQESSSLSGLSSFLETVEVDGWVAGSYWYNFNDPTANPNFDDNSEANQGVNGAFYPFHGDHNSFQVDQVWFGLGKPATEESRGGFRFDIVYGNTAAYLGSGGSISSVAVVDEDGDETGDTVDIRRRSSNDGANDFYINQAYVEYLAPLGPGVNITFGKFGTILGMEVAQTTANFNITRGIVYNLLQPIDHTGVIISTEFDNGFYVKGGLVNSGDLSVSQPDINDEKTWIGGAGWGTDTFSISGAFLYGAERDDATAGQGQKNYTLDFIASWDPNDMISTYINFDYVRGQDKASKTGDAWGIAWATRVQATEDLGTALRVEYVEDNKNFLGLVGERDSQVYAVTGTVDYALTSNLMVRGEVRFDHVKENRQGNLREFLDDSPNGNSSQVVAGAEVVYTF